VTFAIEISTTFYALYTSSHARTKTIAAPF